MLKIAVLISGGGTDLQSIIDGCESGYLDKVSIECVISDRPDVYGLERAKNHGIDTMVFDRKEYKENLSSSIYEAIKDRVDFIVLAGFLSIVKDPIISEYRNRIINIHPSLIPSFCGKGMYGMKVHEAAIDYGVKVSGCTVHFVDENADTGAIILQNTVPVLDTDSPEDLQKRILKEEHIVLPKALKLISEGKVLVRGRKVIVRE